MALYRLQIEPVGRSAGRRATAAAAYRAGERIRDERSRQWFDHSKRKDVLHKEIVLPAQFLADEASWARNRSTLWNAAERAEARRDARVAREYQIALPHELNAEGRLELARAFSRQLADRYQVAVDLAIHAPRPGSDPRNFHAHLLTTTREITHTGLGAKTGLDMSGTARHRRGLQSGIRELATLREQWAELANEALRAAQLSVRIDHRTLEAQGITREPRAALPWGAFRAERQGLRSEVAERVRERHRLRIQARRERYAAAREALAQRPKDLEEIKRQARENWLRFRDSPLAKRPESAREREAARNLDPAHDRPDSDHAL